MTCSNKIFDLLDIKSIVCFDSSPFNKKQIETITDYEDENRFFHCSLKFCVFVITRNR